MKSFNFSKGFHKIDNTDDIDLDITKDEGMLEFNERILLTAEDLNFSLSQRVLYCDIVHRNILEFLAIRPVVQELSFIANQKIFYGLDELVKHLNRVIESLSTTCLNEGYRIEMSPYITEFQNNPYQYPYIGGSLKAYTKSVSRYPVTASVFNIKINYSELTHTIPTCIDILPKELIIHIRSDILTLRNIKFDSDNTDGRYELYNYSAELTTRNIIIHTPFDSYQMITDFIDQMCTDPGIISIYISMYRLAADSKIIKSLIKAASLGKRVYVYIELSARGNEKQNAEIFDQLKSLENIIVNGYYYGFKVHAKCFAAIRADGRIFYHVGTGNYNEDSSKMYTDIHYLASSQKPNVESMEILELLHAVTLNEYPECVVDDSPPSGTFDKVLDLIEYARSHQLQICFKCNNLNDSRIIAALKEAADSGCKIKLILRTIIGISNYHNIEIKTIIGKFLEHERIYLAGSSLDASPQPLAYIGSADALYRNMAKRIEYLLAIPLKDIVTIEDIFNANWNLGGEFE